MDQSLDDILAEHKAERRGRRNDDRRGGNNNSNNGDRNDRDRSDRGNGRRRDRREDFPRDGTYRDEPRKIDEEWVHDRYEDDARRKRRSPDRRAPAASASGTRLRVENLHYDLTTDDLDGLFRRIGPVADVHLVYDRAGRSEGLAYVTYTEYNDARQAIREFDGANAKGQPIRLSIVADKKSVGSGRPLSERISRPKDDRDDYDVESAARRGIDRYVPEGQEGGGRRSRSRSPVRRREGGRRPGDRRGRGRDRDGNGNGNRDRDQNNRDGQNNRDNNRRAKKTQEELDAEMADYFVESGNGAEEAASAPAPAAAAPAAAVHDDGDDADMIG